MKTALLLKAHPYVSLNVLDQVPQVNRSVGVGEGACDENGTCLLRHEISRLRVQTAGIMPDVSSAGHGYHGAGLVL